MFELGKMEMNELVIMGAALILTIVIGMMIKKYTHSFRRPNGKKGGGLVSMHTVIAFAILTVITISFQNVYLTILTAILAYMIARQRVVDQQHYLYQVFFGVVVGVLLPYAIYSVLDKESINKLTSKFGKGWSSSFDKRSARLEGEGGELDQRHQADDHPEFKIPDEDLEYI